MRIAMMCAAMMISSAAMAQAPAAPTPPPAGLAAEVQRSYNNWKGNILKSAEKMPAENYALVPMPEVRTFARVLNHVIEAQNRTCGAVNGTKDAAKPPADTADKATIIAALQASFAECDKAYASVTDANAGEVLSPAPTIKRTRLGMLWGNVSHDNEQYAQLALYLRLKGIVPPSSEK